jgi:hypothetical protein
VHLHTPKSSYKKIIYKFSKCSTHKNKKIKNLPGLVPPVASNGKKKLMTIFHLYVISETPNRCGVEKNLKKMIQT